ncbi:PRC-barrel domain containing protein [Paracoccus gahaiensis]|uniref:PRC-barrel domain containing protein n=1 Tax=Paracoccus gahaiensis TaxID=1706839 RepID=A0A4V5MVY0_9RHOB|nr:PRC-barrel domain-containing protein [Paracoccus gahaiensis]TJZ93928.1 PRC-barrel domain containing protein [Paracoccus gahaiensis]
MRKFLLTTTLALPMSFGAAFAQDTAPAADPAMEPAETAPMTDMGDAPAADPMATTEPMAEETDADEAAAAASAAEKVEVQQAENEWRIDWITGTNVTSPTGDDIGAISDVIVDGDTGEMKAAIIGVGGFLGIGEKQIALPWADLTINSDAQEITTDLTQEEAEAAPEYVFRDQAAAAGDDMMTDPAMGTTDTGMGTAPAADPMATGTEAEPMATEPLDADTMETDTMETETMETDTDTMEMGTDATTTTPAPAN